MLRIIALALLLAIAGLALPHGAPAQQSLRPHRLGYLALGTSVATDTDLEALRQGLRELGWIERQNLTIEYRYAAGKLERLAALANELVQLKVDIIFASSTPAAQAAQRATETIPIVFAGVADPLGTRLVENLARPGKNITGFTTINVELSAKRLELLRTMVDGLARVAVLVNLASPQAPSLRKQTETAAASLGLPLQLVDVRRAEDLPRAFASIAPGVGALLILPDPILGQGEARLQIVDLALKRRLPTMERDRGFAEAGGLMSYGTNLTAHYRGSARHVDSILRGTAPSSLPVEQPTTYELTVNVRTARALGLKVPPTILTQADRVIE